VWKVYYCVVCVLCVRVCEIQTRLSQHMSCSPGQVLHLWRAHSPPNPSLMRKLIQVTLFFGFWFCPEPQSSMIRDQSVAIDSQYKEHERRMVDLAQKAQVQCRIHGINLSASLCALPWWNLSFSIVVCAPINPFSLSRSGLISYLFAHYLFSGNVRIRTCRTGPRRAG